MGRFFIGSLIIMCLFTYSSFGIGQQNPQLIESSNPIKLTTGTNYYPYVDSKALDNGWSVSIVKAVFQQMEKQVNIDVLPWQRGYKWAFEGQYEGTFPYVHTKQRAESFIYSNPINFIPVRVYTAKNKRVKSLNQLVKGRLCLPHGYSLSTEQEQLISEFKLIVQSATNAGGCMLQVAKGWSDLGFINGYLQTENNSKLFDAIQKVHILKVPVANVPLYYIVSRQFDDAQQHIARFNKALELIEKSGEKQRINSQFETFLKAPEQLIGLKP